MALAGQTFSTVGIHRGWLLTDWSGLHCSSFIFPYIFDMSYNFRALIFISKTIYSKAWKNLFQVFDISSNFKALIFILKSIYSKAQESFLLLFSLPIRTGHWFRSHVVSPPWSSLGWKLVFGTASPCLLPPQIHNRL